ncbi:unnamed protein product [Protopolystoma xenopodis]|uniref:Uncharacterized protein n=1 Tax=Protopolystoma xenopodis TaxID=117903 RepID=A0A448WEG3_9PLAT|nr:unnamed protein product [Protopolystoma xenopodis]
MSNAYTFTRHVINELRYRLHSIHFLHLLRYKFGRSSVYVRLSSASVYIRHKALERQFPYLRIHRTTVAPQKRHNLDAGLTSNRRCLSALCLHSGLSFGVSMLAVTRGIQTFIFS